MALLIYGLRTQIGTAQGWRDAVAELLPGLELRVLPDVGAPAEITCLAFIRPDFDAIPPLPNPEAMLGRSAGVEAFVNHPKLPRAPSRVTVMPHVARRPTVRRLVAEIAANVGSVEADGGLLQEIDKAAGY